jgi:hypothetical protein
MFLDFKLILEYFLNIKRDKNKTKINFSNNLGFKLWGGRCRQLMTCATGLERAHRRWWMRQTAE